MVCPLSPPPHSHLPTQPPCTLQKGLALPWVVKEDWHTMLRQDNPLPPGIKAEQDSFFSE